MSTPTRRRSNARLVAATGARGVDYVDGTRLATALIGDAIATNLFMLGYAYQRGLVPLSLAALVRAIELNGVAIDDAKRSFAWGRLAAHDPARVEALAPTAPPFRNARSRRFHRAPRELSRCLSGRCLCATLSRRGRRDRGGRSLAVAMPGAGSPKRWPRVYSS
jgi:hypothetical protein